MGRMPHSEIAAKHDRLVWIDLEMTGLDPERHVIVEVAAVITDGNLNILGEGIDLVVHATEDELAQMDSFVTQMHAKSGLDKEIRESTTSIGEAEDAVLALINEHCDPEHPAPLAGNSIATDRTFIRAYMPRLDSALHYRMIDVSTIKELARRWHPRAYFNQPDKGMAHRTAGHHRIHPRVGLLPPQRLPHRRGPHLPRSGGDQGRNHRRLPGVFVI